MINTEIIDISKVNLDGLRIFNITRSLLLKEKVELISFEDERLGSSKEILHIFIRKGGEEIWDSLDIKDKIEGYNEIPLGYILGDIDDYSDVMVYIQRESSVLLDRVSKGATVYSYHIVSDKYERLCSDMSIVGALASKSITLEDDIDKTYNQIREKMSSYSANSLIENIKNYI